MKTAIDNNTQLTGEQIEKLRNIANCESRNFTIAQKIDLIEAVASKPGLFTQVPESHEDIILDLIESIKTADLAAYHEDFLEALLNKPGLLATLFKELDNVRVAGNENNADRFAQILYTFWADSKYDDIDNAVYTYSDVESRKNYGSSPLLLSYEGDELIVNRDYTSSSISFSGNKISISGKNKPFVSNLFDEGWEDEPFTVSYHPFQPVWFVKESDNTALGPDKYIPAIAAYNMIRNGNYENTMRDINLGVDVILTFTAFGNFTKLKHLSKLQQGGKWIFGGLELSSSALDISLRYGDWCSDGELCKAMQNYNSYLQLGLLGGEVLSAGYKQLLKKKFDDTKEVYNRKRASLEDQLGKDNEDLKDADELFGTVSNTPGGSGYRFWDDYARRTVNGEEYAVVGDKLYSREAIDAVAPSGLGSGASGVSGQGIPKKVVDDVIENGEIAVDGSRQYHSSLDAVVITEDNGKIIRSISSSTTRNTANTNLGLNSKAFIATSQEISASTARIKNIRSAGGEAGNYGYIWGKIDGRDYDIVKGSGEANLATEPQIFKASKVPPRQGEVPYLRNTDSEYKMLNELAEDLGGVYNADITGEIKIVSELTYCTSCRGVIKQFNKMFPNIKLILVNGAK